MNRAFSRIQAENAGIAPPLHPILAALSIVISRREDLGNITTSHPLLWKHSCYHPNIKFPEDISTSLPEQENRWWDFIPVVPRLVDSPRLPLTADNSPPPAGGSPPPAGGSPPPARGSPPPARGSPLPPSGSSSLSGPRYSARQDEQDVPMLPPSPMEVEEEEEEEEKDELAEDVEVSTRRHGRPKVSGFHHSLYLF